MTTSTAKSSRAATAESHGANIIPFPARPPVAPVSAAPVSVAPVSAADRLTVSLANLNAALQEQHAAVVGWKTVMQELKTSTVGLHESLRQYSASLGTLGDSVTTLRDRARSLEKWADDAVAVHS